MQRAAALLFLATLACTSAHPPAASAVDEETRNMITALEGVIAQNPTATPYIYLLATSYDKAGDAAAVEKWVRRLDELQWSLGLGRDGFRNTNTPAFRELAARLDARHPRVNRATSEFTLTGQRDLVPEGIAYDPVDDVLYVSGIHRRKVLRVDRSGNARDFVAEGQDGMLGGLGIKVDEQRRLLWVISTTTKEMRGFVKGDDRSMLAAYDLRDGKLVRKLDATPAMLNDLALLADGSLFATDMGRHKVMRLAPAANAFEVFAEDFVFPNGIALSEDERYLYVADFRGVTRFDLRDNNSRTRIESKELLNGIDGLSIHRGKLIGIQNTIGKPRVIRIDPENGGVEILESKNTLFEIPTTGAVAGDDYYFIANPGLRFFNEADPVMLKIRLTQ